MLQSSIKNAWRGRKEEYKRRNQTTHLQVLRHQMLELVIWSSRSLTKDKMSSVVWKYGTGAHLMSPTLSLHHPLLSLITDSLMTIMCRNCDRVNVSINIYTPPSRSPTVSLLFGAAQVLYSLYLNIKILITAAFTYEYMQNNTTVSRS